MKGIHKHDLPSAAARHRRECDGAADIAGADDAKLYGLRQRALPRTLERINCVTFVFFGDSKSNLSGRPLGVIAQRDSRFARLCDYLRVVERGEPAAATQDATIDDHR